MSSYTLGQYSPALIIPGLGTRHLRPAPMPWELLRLFKLLSYLLCPTCSFPPKLEHIFPWFLSLLTILALLQGSKEEGIMLFIYPNDNFICFLNLLNISSGPTFYKAHFNGLAWLGVPLLLGTLKNKLCFQWQSFPDLATAF